MAMKRGPVDPYTAAMRRRPMFLESFELHQSKTLQGLLEMVNREIDLYLKGDDSDIVDESDLEEATKYRDYLIRKISAAAYEEVKAAKAMSAAAPLLLKAVKDLLWEFVDGNVHGCEHGEAVVRAQAAVDAAEGRAQKTGTDQKSGS